MVAAVVVETILGPIGTQWDLPGDLAPLVERLESAAPPRDCESDSASAEKCLLGAAPLVSGVEDAVQTLA